MHQLATIADLYHHNHTLGLYCIDCNRWAEADLKDLVRVGQGAREITRTRFRCLDCGLPAEKQIRPPVPTTGGAVAYIQPDFADIHV